MRADRERQSMTIHDCHDFHAFSALRRSDPRPATLCHHERRIDEAFRFIQGALVAKLVGYIPSTLAAKLHRGTRFESGDERICSSDSFAAACATARRCLVSTIQLRKHVGSGSACVQDVHRACALPENDSGCAPTARLSAESSDIYSRSTPPSNFEIGSSVVAAPPR